MDAGINEAITARDEARKRDDVASLHEYSDRFGVIDHMLHAFQGDRTKLRWALLELIGAGTDTTASLMVHALYHLSRRPSVWKDLKREVEQILNDRKPIVDDFTSMPYLDAIIKESRF